MDRPEIVEEGPDVAMTDLLPAWPPLSAFLVASVVLAATPGPGVLYIVKAPA